MCFQYVVIQPSQVYLLHHISYNYCGGKGFRTDMCLKRVVGVGKVMLPEKLFCFNNSSF